MGAIQRMDHFTVVTDRLEETRVFYERLGLAVGPRPDFGIGGLWLYVGGHPVLHVIEVQQMPTPRRGALDHMAFMGGDAASTLGLLQQAGIAYRLATLPVAMIPRAQTLAERKGFMKALVGDDGQILGFAMLGAQAGEV